MRPLLRVARLRQPWLLPRHPRNAPQSLVPRRIATTCAQHPAPVDLPRLLVKAGHKDHNSLATFVDYANRTNLSPLKTYYIGTHFEYTTALAFKRLGFSLLRTGGKNDAGIDLVGHWVLAPLSEPLPVFLQCKVRKSTAGPQHVRELEGSFQGVPPSWKGKPVLGLLVTTLKATKGTMDALARSPWPMGFVMMNRNGLIQQFVWNRAASERGLQGVGVTVRHTPRVLLPASELLEENEDSSETPKGKKRSTKFANTGTQKDIQLTWMGSPIFPERETLDQDTLNLIRLVEPEPEYKPVGPHAHDRPTRGRPRKAVDADGVVLTTRGPRPTLHLAPSPRGGQVATPRGPAPIPKVKKKRSKTKVKVSDGAG